MAIETTTTAFAIAPYTTSLDVGSNYSIIVYCEPQSLGTEQFVVGSNKRYRLGFNNTGNVEATIGYGNKFANSDLLSSGAFSNGDKIWMALTYDNVDAKLYVNSLLEDTDNDPGRDSDANTPLGLGLIGSSSTSGFGYCPAIIHFVAIYNRELSEDEVISIMNSYGRECAFPGLLSAYHFTEESHGTTATVASSEVIDTFGNTNYTAIAQGDVGFTWQESEIEFQGGH